MKLRAMQAEFRRTRHTMTPQESRRGGEDMIKEVMKAGHMTDQGMVNEAIKTLGQLEPEWKQLME